MFNIVLYTPQIPQNTGNIARTCAVTGSRLHLIKPYGFVINDKTLLRAGLDYWSELEIFEYDDFNDFIDKNKNCNLYVLTSKGDKNYSECIFKDGDFLLFGSETSGVPDSIHNKFTSFRLKIPMLDNEHARCLNLGNSVGIVLYEALRQNDFLNLSI